MKTPNMGEIASGTRQESDALAGRGLLQSPAEWDARNAELTGSINQLLRSHCVIHTKRALDVGCMDGELTDRYGQGLAMSWYGIDPDIAEDKVSPGGAYLSKGFAHQLDKFRSGYFDAITFCNVYEHLPPSLRQASVAEFHRVLAPGGVLVGQLPNPYFPIESHSRLPFMGYLPRPIQRLYWRLTPTGWNFDQAHFYSVTVAHLRQVAERSGFKTIMTRNFNYSVDAIPSSVRWAAKLHAHLGMLPWAWQFVFWKIA